MANEQSTDASAASGAVISPAEIQQQEFGVTRFGGYRMRDVDEFLDRLTQSAEALIAENERLRAGGSPILGTSDLDDVNRQADEIVQRARDEAARIVREASEEAPVGAGTAAATPADRPAVDAFLSQERDFLQSLATLVQGHAESVKGMARRTRRQPAPEAAATVIVGEAAQEPSEQPDESTEPAATPSAPTSSQDAPPATAAPQEQPARPEPDDRRAEGDPSLKQLFWGEEG